MRAIILAAGLGSRVDDCGKSNKCLMEINGKSIIKHTVETLKNNNIDVTLVLGYHYKNILDDLLEYDIDYLVNPFFRITNSAASLWMANKYLKDDDLLIINGDTYYAELNISKMINCEHEIVLMGDSSLKGGSDFYLYKDLKNGIVTRYSYEINACDGYKIYEYADMAYINKDKVKVFLELLTKYIFDEKYNLWWEYILYENSIELDVGICDINNIIWGEIDTTRDYNRLCEVCREKR